MKKEPENQNKTATQNIVEDFLASSSSRVFCYTVKDKTVTDNPVEDKIVFSTSLTMHKTLLLAEELRKAEAVKQGKPDYEIVVHKGLSVLTHRSHYAKYGEEYDCSMLYKQGEPGCFDEVDHCTLILTKNPEAQVEMVDDVVAGHCAHYHKSTTKGYADTEVPYLSVEGSYKDQELDPLMFSTRGAILSAAATIRNGSLYDFVMSSPITDSCIDMTSST